MGKRWGGLCGQGGVSSAPCALASSWSPCRCAPTGSQAHSGACCRQPVPPGPRVPGYQPRMAVSRPVLAAVLLLAAAAGVRGDADAIGNKDTGLESFSRRFEASFSRRGWSGLARSARREAGVGGWCRHLAQRRPARPLPLFFSTLHRQPLYWCEIYNRRRNRADEGATRAGPAG